MTLEAQAISTSCVARLGIIGPLRARDCADLHEQVAGHVAKHAEALVILDLGSLTALDLDGVGWLVGVRRTVLDFGGRFLIVAASRVVRDVVARSGLDGLLDLRRETFGMRPPAPLIPGPGRVRRLGSAAAAT